MSRRRAWSVAGLSSTAALAAAAGGASWYYANRLTQPPADLAVPEPEPHDVVEVVAVEGGVAWLRGPEAARLGVWGLDAPGGYGRVADVLDGLSDGDVVARRFTPITGQVEHGDHALLDGYAYPPDGAALESPAIDTTYASGVGPAPAWFVPGDSDTWVICVHGRAARRHEAFRLAPTAALLGHPVLAISYRNDAEAPRSPDNRSHLGHTEWLDVEAAIDHAVARGARDVILVGYSMGGACVVACARRSTRAGRIRGLVLEAPVLDWGPVVRRAAVDRGLPSLVLPALLPATMALARARMGIDFAQLRSDPAALQWPTLLIHGDADEVVPVELSDVLAHARPDVVTYLRVPGARHVRSWNADPDLYGSTVRAFLDAI